MRNRVGQQHHPFGYMNLLSPQVFAHEEEAQVIFNNLCIDYFLGHLSRENMEIIVDRFRKTYPELVPKAQDLMRKDRRALKDLAMKAKHHVVLMTIVMFTGLCNANCEICYTDRKKKPNELTWEEIRQILDQTKRMGSRTLYIPGEGEPTLDPSFFRALNYAQQLQYQVLFFTNGIVFSNDQEAKRYWGVPSDTLVDRVVHSGAYLYFKLWSFDPDKMSQMMGIQRNMYQWVKVKYGWIPAGLYKFLHHPGMNRDRIGIEVVVERRTVDEILEKFLPFIQEYGIKSYFEPIIHSGRYFGGTNYDLSQEQIHRIRRFLVRQNCPRVNYMYAITNDGYVTPAISVSPRILSLFGNLEELYIRGSRGEIRDLFYLRYRSKFLAKYRYEILGCLCERMNQWAYRGQI